MAYSRQTSYEEDLLKLREKYHNGSGINRDGQRRTINYEHESSVFLINQKWDLAKKPLEQQVHSLQQMLIRMETDHHIELNKIHAKTKEALKKWHEEVDPDRYGEYLHEKNELDTRENIRQSLLDAAAEKEKYKKCIGLFSNWDNF